MNYFLLAIDYIKMMTQNTQVSTSLTFSKNKTLIGEQGINWWATPPELPDLNPIENIWGSLKQYLCTTHKPRNLDELKRGIQQFWMTLTPEICQCYIGHIQRVIPQVVEVNDEPSGY